MPRCFRSLSKPATGLIDLLGQFGVVALDLGVRIPFAAAAAAMKDLHKAHAAFHQAPRRQALFAERFGLALIQAVQLARGRAFPFPIAAFPGTADCIWKASS